MIDERALGTESALAVIGLRAILAGEPAKYGAGSRKEALALPKRIKELARDFLQRPDFGRTAPLPAFDFAKVAKSLVSSGKPAVADALTEAIPDHVLAADVLAKASAIVEYLNARVPRREREGLDGTEVLPPPEQAQARFARIWQVACDPLIVLRDLAEGSLTRAQAETFRTLFPSLYEVTHDAIADALATFKAGRKSWRLSYAKERQLRTLYGLPLHNVTLAQQIQQAYAKAKQQRQQSSPTKAKALSAESEKAATANQRVEAGPQR